MPGDHARLRDSIHGTGILVQDGLEHVRIGHETITFIDRRSENWLTP